MNKVYVVSRGFYSINEGVFDDLDLAIAYVKQQSNVKDYSISEWVMNQDDISRRLVFNNGVRVTDDG